MKPSEGQTSDTTAVLPEYDLHGHGQEAAESALAWDTCTKNPGHSHFVPLSNFSLEHLPSTVCSQQAFDAIAIICKLTARLRVTHTSSNRPLECTLSQQKGGKNAPRLGNGWVIEVVPGEGPCICRTCEGRDDEVNLRWWSVHMRTACHVVCSTEEASFTRVDLFYDNNESMKDGKVKSLRGIDVLATDLEGDVSDFQCVTHEEDLAVELHGYLNQLQRIWFKRDHFVSQRLEGVVIVSHPHGRPKQVSVRPSGWLRRTQEEDIRERRHHHMRRLIEYPKLERICCIYKTDTCPGSSGALVIFLDSYSQCNLSTFTFIHSGAGSINGFNMSSSRYVRSDRPGFFPTCDRSPMFVWRSYRLGQEGNSCCVEHQ